MPDSNIEWKGYPHRHLPRIRRPSSHCSSVRSRHVSRLRAARKLLSSAFQKRKGRCFPSRRRSPLSVSSLARNSALEFRRRVSTRARQNIQAFGWNTDIAGEASTARNSSTITPAVNLDELLASLKSCSETTVIEFDTTDGAVSSKAGSKVLPAQGNVKENICSPKKSKTDPVYWSKASRPLNEVLSNTSRLAPARPGRESCDGQPIRGSQIYDSGIDPKGSRNIQRKPVPARPKTSAGVPRAARNSQLSIENPAVRETINCLACAVKDPASIAPSVKSIVNTLSSCTASRTPTQKKAIKQFTQEIGLYLQAVRSLPKQTLYPSPSVTTVSAHTITELSPFRPEFQAAGLAVTSTEQKTPLKMPTRGAPPPPTPPKDERWAKGEFGGRRGKQTDKHQSVSTISSETTILEFTPPNEKSYGSKKEKTPRYSSSEVTEIGFTPPDELYSSLSKRPALVPTTSSKKSLPWLQRPDQPVQPVEEPIFVTGPSKELLERSRSRGRPNPNPNPSPHSTPHATDPGRKISKYGAVGRTAQISPRKPIRPAVDAQTDAEVIEADVEEPIIANYANAATQATLPFIEPLRLQRTKDPIKDPERAPLICDRRSTVPAQTPKYTDKTVVEKLGDIVPKRAQVFWKEVDSEAKTDEGPLVAISQTQSLPHHKRSSLKLDKMLTAEVESASESMSEPGTGTQSAPRAALLHQCTARSSLQCQQCDPPDCTSQPISPFQTSIPSPQYSPRLPQLPVRSYTQFEQHQQLEASSQAPPCSVKAPPSPPNTWSPNRSLPASQCIAPRKPQSPPIPQGLAPHYCYYTCDPPKRLPPQQPIMIARPFPDSPSVATSLDACARDHKITDKQVFKGLHVATAAACDEAVDKWIEDITGYGVRKLLADLSRFEGLGTNTLADVARRASKHRRDQARDWELVRQSRLAGDKKQLELHFVKDEKEEAQTSNPREEKEKDWEDL